jgi:YD repeat-containing protein
MHRYLFLVSVVILIGTTLTVNGQNTISYAYDNSGNRISRTITVAKSASIDTEEENEGSRNNQDISNKNIHKGELNNIQFSIYPNPTRESVEIKTENLPMESKAIVMVFDVKGVLILKQDWISSSTILDLSQVAAVTYLLKVLIDSQVSEWKIIKE